MDATMLKGNLVDFIESMLTLYIHGWTKASDDRLPCLKNPRPEGSESSITESASSPSD
jgi:hypothetical protein